MEWFKAFINIHFVKLVLQSMFSRSFLMASILSSVRFLVFWLPFLWDTYSGFFTISWSLWCLSLSRSLVYSLKNFVKELGVFPKEFFFALVLGGPYAETNSMFHLSVFSSTITCSKYSISTSKSFCCLDHQVLFTKMLAPPSILLGLHLLYNL